VYVPADDLTDSGAGHGPSAFGRNHRCWNVRIAELGIFPAVDPLRLELARAGAGNVGQEHYDVPAAFSGVLQRYKDLQDIIAIWAWTNCHRTTK